MTENARKKKKEKKKKNGRKKERKKRRKNGDAVKKIQIKLKSYKLKSKFAF
jgi:hypothetical protein